MSQTVYPPVVGQLLKKRVIYASGSSSSSSWTTVLTITPTSGYRIISALFFVCGSYQSTSTSYPSGYRIRANYSDGSSYTLKQRTSAGTTLSISCDTPDVISETIGTTKDPAPYITSLYVDVLAQSSTYPANYYVTAIVYEIQA